MIKNSEKKYSTAIYLYSLFIPFKWMTKHKNGSHLSSLIGMNSPKETPNTHYMMLHSRLFPWLIIELVPQGLDTIKTSLKGVQQHTIITYIRISSKFTNTSTTNNYLSPSSIYLSHSGTSLQNFYWISDHKCDVIWDLTLN